MVLDVLDIVKNLARIGVRLTEHQRKYLNWRLSDKGKEYFSAGETNAFYKALSKGDTDVIDVELHKRQRRLDDLASKLGFSFVFMCLLSSCIATKQQVIPVKDKPQPVVEVLLDTERTYTVEDMPVIIDGEDKELSGLRYIVTPDFIKIHRRNQDTAIKAAELALKYKRYMTWAASAAILFAGALLGAVFMRKKSK